MVFVTGLHGTYHAHGGSETDGPACFGYLGQS